MKKYELSIVFHPDLEMNLDPALDKVRQILSSANANIIKETSDGKKRLAYSIKGEEYGIYYFIDVELPTDVLDKVSNTLNITDEVLRFLLVRADVARTAKGAENTEVAETTDAADAAEVAGDDAKNKDNTNKEEEQ